MSKIDHNFFNEHKNDAPNFPCNGAARLYSFKKEQRHLLNCKEISKIPVVVIDGFSPPKLIGERGGWYTKGGSPINHPNAYSKNGWSNMVYKSDSREIVVGKHWRPFEHDFIVKHLNKLNIIS